MPDSFSNVLRDIKISELPVAGQANVTDQLEANQSGTTRSITLDQVSSVVAGSDQIGVAIAAALAALSPAAFGAIGDGIAQDDDAITAWLAFCEANNLKAVTTPGKRYKLSDSFIGYIRVPFDGTGSEFLQSNNDQPEATFRIDSLAGDIEDLTLAHINTWTGLYRGSQKIPQLAERNWSYNFATTDQNVINRSNDLAVYAKGDAFEVTGDDGSLSKQLCCDYTTPFTEAHGQRRRLRDVMEVKGLVVRIAGGSAERDEVIRVWRPRTRLVNCEIINDTTVPLTQGFRHFGTTSIIYDNCRINGTEPLTSVATAHYGWNGDYCDDVTFRNCSAVQCRRDIDSNVCSNYKIDGGNFPDGIGGHWVNGFHVYGKAYISQRDDQNLNCIAVAGSNVDIESARIHMPPAASAALSMRGDFPEMRGLFRLGPGVEITIDETGDVAAATQKYICRINIDTYTGGASSASSGRAIYLPDLIDIRPGSISQIRNGGTASDNIIQLLSIPGKTAAQFSQNINAPANIIIAPGTCVLQDGFTSGAAARLLVVLGKSDTQVGGPCKVVMDRMQKVDVFASPASSSAGAAGRYDIDINNVADASVITVRNGVYRRVFLTRVNPASTVSTAGGGAPAVLDEQVQWDSIVETGTYTPTGTISTNVTVATPGVSYYTITRNGPLSICDVWGSASVTATLTASTPSQFFFSLPVASNMTSLTEVIGIATSTSGNQPPAAGVRADTTNDRAEVNYLSVSTNSTFLFRIAYRVK